MGISLPSSFDAASIAGFLSEPLVLAIGSLAFLFACGLVVLAIVRANLRKKYQTSVAFRMAVMLVTVPKEQAEKGESGQQEKELRQIQEKIGIMESVFASIGGLPAQRGFKAWLVGREDAISFEIAALRGLVQFFVAVPPHLKDFVQQQIHAQFSSAQIDDVADYNIFTPQGQVAAARLGFRQNHYFPIKTYKKIETDPLNALTNALAKVDRTDGAAIQIVIRSAKREWRQTAISFVKSMQAGLRFSEALAMTTGIGWLMSMFRTTKKPGDPQQKEYRMSPIEEEMVKTMDEKIGKLGIDVNVRVVASAATSAAATGYVNNILGAFTQFNMPTYGNSLVRYGQSQRTLIKNFIFRHFDEKPRTVMTGEELSSLYHFPLPSTETPNILWLTARRSPPPTNLPKEGLYCGFIEYRDDKVPVYLKNKDRFRHMYMIGKSGSGKSEYIANFAVQDIKSGAGVCIVDPHGDLVENVLSCVPKERADDVIIFDPSDMERPIALNMLESPSEEMNDFVAGEMIAIFYKLFPPEMIGPMFEHTMRNLILTLMSDKETPGTIAEIPRLITDPAYQKEWVAKVKDPVVRSYWENEVARTSDFHKSEMFGYLISKVGRFVENTMLRNIIGQSRSALDFRKIMDERKIFLVNLSKGKIGDINAQLLGLIIVTKLQMAVMARASMPEEERKDFFLYIDEFQNFVTPSIATILSEARKYRISLIIAHQYMAQLAPKGDTEVRDAVMGNVGSMFIGRIGIDDAEILQKEFAPVFSAYDFVNVPMFTWYSKLLIDNTASRPFAMKAPPPVRGDRRLGEALKQLSRLKYGRDRMIVEEEIMTRSKINVPLPKPAAPPPAAK